MFLRDAVLTEVITKICAHWLTYMAVLDNTVAVSYSFTDGAVHELRQYFKGISDGVILICVTKYMVVAN